MKHIDLVKLVYENRELIDKAYKQDVVENVSEELVESTLFVKISGSYKLNKNYLNFVNSVLQRVDYSIIFGDYEKEYKELVKNKNRYIESNNEYYKNQIINLIETLYFKFFNRDREIQVLLLRIENEISLDIDILVENANDILQKIDELIVANTKIGHLFREDLRGIDSDIDEYLSNISVNILKYIENIDIYIKRINFFIIQTKKRRLQNKNIIKLSNLILEEKTAPLEEFLMHHKNSLFHTVSKNQRAKINTFADDKDMAKISRELKSVLGDYDVKKPVRNSIIKPQAKQKLDIINIENILKDLESGCSDIFEFIITHKELKKYEGEVKKEEAFKLFLQISTDKRLKFKESFNNFGVKVAKWE